ncbi:MAG: ATP-binding protein [Alphaproteobacteria bacterium]|nr:ATP-binding protein [Alphaproteobacteria bacterium]
MLLSGAIMAFGRIDAMPGQGWNLYFSKGLFSLFLFIPFFLMGSGVAFARVGEVPFSPSLGLETLTQRLDMRFMLMGIIVSALILICLFMFFKNKRLRRTLDKTLDDLGHTALLLEQADIFLEAQEGLTLIWKGELSVVVGHLPEVSGVPRETERLLSFESWLAPAALEILVSHLNALVIDGEWFKTNIRTYIGTFIGVQGRIVGGYPVLLLQMLTGNAFETAQLRDRLDEVTFAHQGMWNLLNVTRQPVWILGKESQIGWINTAYAHAVGCATRQEALDKGSFILDPNAQSCLVSRLDEDAFFCDYFEGRDVSQSSCLMVTASRIAEGVLCLGQDVSELQNARQELSLKQKAYAHILDRFPIAMAVFGKDQRLFLYNQAYARLWGIDDEWLCKAPLYSEILDAQRRHLPEQADYRDWRERYLEMLKCRKMDPQFWHLSDSKTTLRVTIEQDVFDGVMFLYENMTEKFQLESRTNALEEIQRETLDNLNEGVVLFSSDGRLRLFNSAFVQIWGLSSHELKGEPHIDQLPFFSSQGEERYGKTWATLKQRVTTLDDERRSDKIRFESQEGNVIDCAVAPLPGGGTLIHFMNVTDMVRAEKVLRERNETLEVASEMRSAFVRHVSYVLRVPLTTIIGYTDLLMRDPSGVLTGKPREFAENILTSSQALQSIISDILDLATIDAGTMDLTYGPVDLDKSLSAIIDGLRDRLQGASIDLNLIKRGDLSGFIADESRVKQVLFNLLSNAVTFANSGGRITLVAECCGEEVRFSVIDTGRGISKVLQSSIFNPFEGISSSGTGPRGAGLGLSIVRGLVELHNGYVCLVSTPGKGTKVLCVFPLSPYVDYPRPLSVAEGMEEEMGAGVSVTETHERFREEGQL